MNAELPFLLSYKDLQKLFKISRSSLWRWESKSTFPKHINIGNNSVRWRRDEVEQWIDQKINRSLGSSLIEKQGGEFPREGIKE